VHEIFTISRFSHLIPIFATVEEASAAWEAPVQPHPAAPHPDAMAEPEASLHVRFWGTRGSLPAPLREQAVRGKIRDALLAARGHTLDTPDAIDAFIDHALPFSVRGTFGGNTSCVEIITGGDEYVLCDLGTGVYANSAPACCGSMARRASTLSMCSCHTRTGTTSWGSRFLPRLTFPATSFASTDATAA